MTVAFRKAAHKIVRIDGSTALGYWWSEAPSKFEVHRVKYPSFSSWVEVVEKSVSQAAGVKGGGTVHWLIVEGQYVLAVSPKSGGPMVEIRPEALEAVAA